MATVLPEEDHYNGYNAEKGVIYNILAETRLIKSEAEIDVMRWASKITVEGHIEFLKRCKPGMRES